MPRPETAKGNELRETRDVFDQTTIKQMSSILVVFASLLVKNAQNIYEGRQHHTLSIYFFIAKIYF